MSKSIQDIVNTALTSLNSFQHPEELSQFAAFIAGVHPRNIMEIGSYGGASFYVLCKLTQPDGIKISLDLDGYGMSRESMIIRNEVFKEWADNVVTIIGDSHNGYLLDTVKTALDGRQLDILFIDGDHTYEGVKLDYEMYSPLVRDGGYIVFHDINDSERHRQSNCYVSRLWNELSGEKVEFNIKADWGGIGILRKS